MSDPAQVTAPVPVVRRRGVPRGRHRRRLIGRGMSIGAALGLWVTAFVVGVAIGAVTRAGDHSGLDEVRRPSPVTPAPPPTAPATTAAPGPRSPEPPRRDRPEPAARTQLDAPGRNDARSRPPPRASASGRNDARDRPSAGERQVPPGERRRPPPAATTSTTSPTTPTTAAPPTTTDQTSTTTTTTPQTTTTTSGEGTATSTTGGWADGGTVTGDAAGSTDREMTDAYGQVDGSGSVAPGGG